MDWLILYYSVSPLIWCTSANCVQRQWLQFKMHSLNFELFVVPFLNSSHALYIEEAMICITSNKLSDSEEDTCKWAQSVAEINRSIATDDSIDCSAIWILNGLSNIMSRSHSEVMGFGLCWPHCSHAEAAIVTQSICLRFLNSRYDVEEIYYLMLIRRKIWSNKEML